MSSRGKPLEIAIGRQAKAYLRAKRGYLVKQETPTSTGPDRTVIYSGRAPVDFLGVDDTGTALAVEAKSTERPSWPIDDLREDQREALQAMHDLGAKVWLVLAFDKAGETYRIGWPELAAFLDKPWRESLSVAWCRAFGLVVPETDREDGARRRCLFLDAQEAPGAAQARVDVIEDRERCLARPARPEPSQEAMDLPRAYVPPATEEERRARIIAATQAGIANQLKRAAMTRKWGRR